MTNNSVLIALVCTLATMMLYRELSAKIKAANQKRQEASDKERAGREAMMASMATLSKSMDAAAQAGIDSTQLLAGTLKACESVATATVGLREVVTQFTKLVGAKQEAGYPEDNYQPAADEAQVNRTAAFIEALARNMPVEQALQEAKEAEEKKMMYSTISMGPEN